MAGKRWKGFKHRREFDLKSLHQRIEFVENNFCLKLKEETDNMKRDWWQARALRELYWKQTVTLLSGFLVQILYISYFDTSQLWATAHFYCCLLKQAWLCFGFWTEEKHLFTFWCSYPIMWEVSNAQSRRPVPRRVIHPKGILLYEKQAFCSDWNYILSHVVHACVTIPPQATCASSVQGLEGKL